MTDASLSGTTEISTARWKTAFVLAGSLVFVAVVLLRLRRSDEDSGMLYLALGFFGLCAAAGLVLLIRPHRLLLDSEGFTLVGGLAWSPKKVLWRDIDEFFVLRAARGTKMIGFNYRPGAREDRPMARFIRAFGADGALPSGWPQSPATMVDRLNAYRSRAQ